MKKLWVYFFAAIISVTGVGVGTIATATAAEAVPYKMPAGTWGRQTHYVDRYHSCVNNKEVRYREDYRMYWNGSYWYNAVYYRGTYYATDFMGYARYCGWV